VAEDLVAAWNAGEDTRAIATAELAPAEAAQFEPVTLTAPRPPGGVGWVRLGVAVACS
jgi:hypothetical protein